MAKQIKSDTSNERHMLSIMASPALDQIRTASMHGDEFTIVPCIALVEGVLWPANAPEPELALAEEFGRIPSAWNGRPLVMNHPMKNGVPVSAGSPDILETACFGQIFNTELRDNTLHTELWINNTRVAALGGEIQETVERLLSGEETVDVSVGLFSRSDNVPGIYNGKKYSAVWRNIVPDHLAVLSKGVPGACSVADGCGAPRINGASALTPVMKAVRLEAQAATESAEDIPVVKAACSCAQSTEGTEHKGVFARLKEHLTSMTFKLRDNAALSDQDLRRTLSIALNKKFDSHFWIVAVFQESQTGGNVVYEDYDGKLLQRSYTVSSDGGVSFGASDVEVRPETQFVPVVVNAGDQQGVHVAQETDMTKQERVAALIANEATKFTTEDTDFLMGLEDGQLTKLEPVTASAIPAAPAATPTKEEPVTLESYLAQAPAEVRVVMNSAINLHNTRRTELVEGLKANSRNKFSEAQLNSFDLETLESMAALADLPDYSGQGVGSTAHMRTNAAAEPDYAEAPDLLGALSASH